jgi:hypothetical protein
MAKWAAIVRATRSQADRDGGEFSLPGFLEKPPPPPVNSPAAEDMPNRAHTNLLCYRRVIQSQTNFPAEAGELSHFKRLGACWLGREGSNLRMAESKSAALPLGYAPTVRREWRDQTWSGESLAALPVYRGK